jgi:hypothetical protein
VRISSRSQNLWCVCSASLALGLWGLASAQAKTSASAGPPRIPKIHVLATAVIDATPSAGTHKGEVVPQIWTYEHSLPGGQPARARGRVGGLQATTGSSASVM